MTLKELLDYANLGYPEAYLEVYYDEEGKFNPAGSGDGLARFIVEEIIETYDASSSDEEQLREAIRVMERAVEHVHGVVEALYEEVEE